MSRSAILRELALLVLERLRALPGPELELQSVMAIGPSWVVSAWLPGRAVAAQFWLEPLEPSWTTSDRRRCSLATARGRGSYADPDWAGRLVGEMARSAGLPGPDRCHGGGRGAASPELRTGGRTKTMGQRQLTRKQRVEVAGIILKAAVEQNLCEPDVRWSDTVAQALRGLDGLRRLCGAEGAEQPETTPQVVAALGDIDDPHSDRVEDLATTWELANWPVKEPANKKQPAPVG